MSFLHNLCRPNPYLLSYLLPTIEPTMSMSFAADSDSESENDDWIYEQQAPSVAGASTIQKISQKEKSIYEMIDVLNARLDR